MFETKYRIVRDRYLGYEVQWKYWWCPFYVPWRINTHASVEEAEEYANQRGVVKYL